MERIMKAKQIKRLLQLRKTYSKLDYDLDFGYSSERGNCWFIQTGAFFKTAKLFGVKPVISKNNDSSYDTKAEMYIDGILLHCIYSSQKNVYDYDANSLLKQYKEIFFDVEDKEKAFSLLRDKVLEKFENRTYKSKNDKKPVIFYLKNYTEFEHYLNRHKNNRDSYETIWSNYLIYKNKFEPLDTDDLTWKEVEELRPNEDYDYPMNFKQWYKVNY